MQTPLPNLIRGIMQGYAALRVQKGAETGGSTATAIGLAKDLMSLPEGMIPKKDHARLREWFPVGATPPPLDPGKIDVLRRLAEEVLPDRTNWLTLPSPSWMGAITLFHSEVHASYEIVIPLSADPNEVTLSGYRLVERSALLYYLTSRQTQLILVPSFTGMGKKSHISPEVVATLRDRGAQVLYLDMKNNRREIGRLRGLGVVLKKKRLPDTLPHVVVIEGVFSLPPTEIRQIGDIVKRYLQRTKGKAVLTGGSDSSTRLQEIFLTDYFGGMVSTDRQAIVPIEVKPLNSYQAHQVLTGRAKHLSEEGKRLFTTFVLERVPHYLSTLKPFEIAPYTLTLDDALANFERTMEEKFLSILAKSRIFPEGISHGLGPVDNAPMFEKVEAMLDRLDADITALLRSCRAS